MADTLDIPFDNETEERQLDALLRILFFNRVQTKDPNAIEGMRVDVLFQIAETKQDEVSRNSYVLNLISDGYAAHPLVGRENIELKHLIYITNDGLKFLFSGGYEKKRIVDARAEKQLDLEIKLNEQLIKHNTSTQWAIWLGAFFAFCSLIISFLAYLKD